jgi:GT2 family glycosyltransferase
VPLTTLTADDQIPLARGDVAVCVPLYGAHEAFVECLRSLLEHTPADVPILISDDCSPDERSRAHIERLDAAGALEREVHYVRHDPNGGFVANVNDAFARLAPADVVVVNSDCVVTEGWLDALRRGADSDTLVATVSVFTNHGTILSLPHRNRPQPKVPQTTTGDIAAARIAHTSQRLHPRIPTLVGHCFLVKRSALELVGDFDLAFSPGYGEEVDFAQRCALHGLVHVVADDAFVVHHGSTSFSADEKNATLQRDNDRVIGVRYPYYYDWVGEVERDDDGPFSRSLRIAERAFRGLTVAIDGRCLGPIATGTQVATLELIVGLARRSDVQLTVVGPDQLGAYAVDALAGENLRLVTVAEVERGIDRADVAHRPYQVASAEDLKLLSRIGNRVVVTHLDLIGFNNPGYFADYDAWASYRRLTRQTLGLADGVAFISRTAAEEAVAQELVERDHAHVVHLGTDHTLAGLPSHERPPASVEAIGRRPFLLCLGTDFRHKNRVFALRLLRALRERHDWDGALVFAGAHVAHGSSAPEEAAFLTEHSDLAPHVVDVAAVDDGEKRWLMSSAAAMVYPSVHEGFGFVPFESADAGLPCVFAAQTSLAELLPTSLALIEPWDADITADRVIELLRDERLRAEHVAAVRASAARLTWNRSVAQTADVYARVVHQPSREARRIAATFAAEREAREELAERFGRLEQDWYALRERFDPMTEHLADALPADLRRPMLAIATRPVFSRPLFGTMRFLYRLGYRMTHFGRRPPSP